MAFLDYSTKRIQPSRRVRYFGLYLCGGKRLFDLFLCLLVLPAAAPMIGCLWCIAAASGPSGFFGHVRVGKDGKVFRCWKIRTMVANADGALADFLGLRPDCAKEWKKNRKLQNDPRIIPFGRILRQTSLDELPQIWNVIKGDMSLVGPRPVTRTELRYYQDSVQDYLAIRPGVTGLWQVTDRQNACYTRRVQLDTQYFRNLSFMGDLLILAKTVPALVWPTGR